MKTLIIGAAGQLGRELLFTAPVTADVTAVDADSLDIRDYKQVADCLRLIRPRVIINCAAYTAVDRAESESEQAYAVNSAGIGHIATAATALGDTQVIHLSTDFIFDGRSGTPYLPDSSGVPLSVYGKSKWEGERRLLGTCTTRATVVRTAWLYSHHGENFVLKMLELLRVRDSLRVVADQIGTPTWARRLAQAIWRITELPAMHGIFHWTDAGVASWYDFAVAIQEEAVRLGLLDRVIPILPIRTCEYPTPAIRPAYSVLDKSSTWERLGQQPPHWRAALRSMLEDLRDGPHE
jgi:dTDP-4-dehydrorhamnose reductase